MAQMYTPTRTNSRGVQVEGTMICVVMVGLPARGKSLIAQKGTQTSSPVITALQLTESFSRSLPPMAVD